MNERVTFTITALLSGVLGALHLADDVVRGFEPGGVSNETGILILVVWFYAALVLNGRRSGYIILLIASIAGAAVPLIHMRGAGMVGSRVVNSGAVFFFVFTLMALGVTSTLSAILAARGLWSLRRGTSASSAYRT